MHITVFVAVAGDFEAQIDSSRKIGKLSGGPISVPSDFIRVFPDKPLFLMNKLLP